MMTESVEVVSLSVCNSGKGEITYEGTEGLQSALKSAGVDSMILTLWTVTKFGASPPSFTAENPVVFSEHHHPKTLKTL